MTDFVDPLEEPFEFDRERRYGDDFEAQDAAAARYDAERREHEVEAERHEHDADAAPPAEDGE
ncbi:hypothetical protein [Agromyces salentinus]|uniref:SPOR domain-containing protein n=1 Tax=Agromyces salentinus TaxID=269421 RepID=A0ABN2MUB1_9MICO|nr:hypothetical protein [Agromyces salentinus]